LERRIEKNVQKDREAEKGLFDDKEAFVTDAYRRKMEQIREEEERARRQEELEGMSLVSLFVFVMHLLLFKNLETWLSQEFKSSPENLGRKQKSLRRVGESYGTRALYILETLPAHQWTPSHQMTIKEKHIHNTRAYLAL